MTEEQQKEPAPEQVEEPTAQPTAPPPDPTAGDLIAKANEAAARIERAQANILPIIERMEQFAVRNTLAGKAAATSQQKEETPEDYAKKALQGEIGGKESNTS